MKGLLVGVLLATSAFSSECIVNRAALDIGSGTTKLKVAKLDICKSQILKILLESNRAVGYKQDLKQSENNKLSSIIIEQGKIALKELKEQASEFSPDQYIAVATSAFRTATNGLMAAKQLSRSSGVKVKVISQREEAIIGFHAALPYAQGSLEDLVVWDIGGGSMQMTSHKGNQSYEVYEGKLASVSFKNLMIEEVKGQDSKKITTPNPISESEKIIGKRDAKILAQITLPSSLKEKLSDPKTTVIGIGGVHCCSVGRQVSREEIYTKKQLDNHIQTRLDLDDNQIGGDYASTDVSNLILVAGFMEGLRINSVKVAQVNLADGILLNPKLIFP